MDIQIDPENSEKRALAEYANLFKDKRVLEIGCGNGRVTSVYAPFAASVYAIDPDPDDIDEAVKTLPEGLREVVYYETTSIEAFSKDILFDAVLLSWSL
jgi:2-polyprenyl-3-methyl-5-hydroxy-6-metoxy-1,4-benzoquinol methylase